MVDQLETLRKLQAIDAELFRLRTEQQQKPLELERARQVVAEQRANAQAIEARLKAMQVQQKAQELELATREANVKKLQVQLFQVKTNKEYAAIQREIDQSKADVSLTEEEIIHLLDAVDRTKQEHTGALVQLTEREATLRSEEQRIERELATLGEQIATFEQQRQTLTPAVPAALLATYERVLASREGLALVPLVNDSCGGCHMVQPPQVVNEVSLKATLVTCENCNRILYVDESR